MNLKQRQPYTYLGRRDRKTINAVVYRDERNLSLVEVGAQNIIAESDKIRYAESLSSVSAANWWFLIVQVDQVPVS